MKRVWIVRGGSKGEREEPALKHNRSIIGWEEAGDFSELKSRNAIREHLKKVYPGWPKGKFVSHASQLDRFVNIISAGDLIIMPRKFQKTVAIGKVLGGYEYISIDGGTPCSTRSVKWHKHDVQRNKFKEDISKHFKMQGTTAEIKEDSVFKRTLEVVETGEDPSPPDKPRPESMTATNLILYGPPGTGKTYWLDKKTEEYSGRKTGNDGKGSKQGQTRENWLRQEFSSNPNFTR